MPSKLTLQDVDITCGLGWIPIIQRLLDELNAASVQMTGMQAIESHGRLRLRYDGIGQHIFGEVGRIVVLAEFRSMYVCEICGSRGGQHRRADGGWLSTRCEEHQDPAAAAGELRFDMHRHPWRRMSGGDLEYDPVADAMVPRRHQPD